MLRGDLIPCRDLISHAFKAFKPCEDIGTQALAVSLKDLRKPLFFVGFMVQVQAPARRSSSVKVPDIYVDAFD